MSAIPPRLRFSTWIEQTIDLFGAIADAFADRIAERVWQKRPPEDRRADTMPPVVDVAGLSKLLGYDATVNPSTIYRWESSGRIPRGRTLGGKKVWVIEEVLSHATGSDHPEVPD